MMDIYSGWKVLVIAVGLGFIFSLMYMVFLRCCTKILIWISFIGFFVLLGIMGGFFFQKYKTETDEDYILIYKVLVIVFWCAGGLVLLLFFCLYNDIQVSLSIIEASAMFMFSNWCVIFIPIIINVAAAAFVVYWSVTGAHLLSLGNFSQWGETPFPKIDWSNVTLRNLCIYHVIAFYWIWAFLISLNQFIISGTAIQWYFNSNSDKGDVTSICKTFCWAFFYHIGSLAFGSFFLGLIMLIQTVFEYMRKKVMENGEHNKLMKCVLACFACCLRCIGECILFLNKNAYIQVFAIFHT